MSNAALCLGSVVVYWDAILVALAALAGFLAIFAAYTPNGGKPGALCLLAPTALLLSFGLSRAMYWYCHQEQFDGLRAALCSPSSGGFCLSGVVLGYVLAVLLLRLLRVIRSGALLLDCSAPGLMLALALLRLSSLFTNACRGKMLIAEPRFQRLPFSCASVTASGATEYRFAAFFAEAILFALAFLLLLRLFVRFASGAWKNAAPGDVFLFFLLFYSAAELVIDSTRNDASFFRFNGFVSVAQILSAAAILGVLTVFSRRSIRRGGLRPVRALCWALFFLGLAGAGISEYLVQRHGNWYLSCYSLMSLCSLVMIASAAALHRDPGGSERSSPCGNAEQIAVGSSCGQARTSG